MAHFRLPNPGDPIRAGDLAEIARVAGHSHSGPGVSVHGGNVTFLGPPPAGSGRSYRRFTLTSRLDAGGDATVEWLDGETGTVYDRDTCCWGLEGETGEAVLVSDKDGDSEWRVCKNPGQGGYPGTLKSDTTSSPCDVNIVIEGVTRTVSCVLWTVPPSGEKYASGTKVYVLHFRGSWEIASVLECTVSA
jgi:hypothetical protein